MVTRIGDGDFSEPLKVRGNDKLSQLAQALNAMSAKLREQQQRIHDESAERLATVEQLRHADRLKTVRRLAVGVGLPAVQKLPLFFGLLADRAA